MDNVIAKGDNPFTKYNQFKLYEICYSRNNKTFPRVNLMKSIIEQFPTSFKERSYYTVRKNERETGLTALRELSNKDLEALETSLNFDLKPMLTDDLIERLFTKIEDTVDVPRHIQNKLPGSSMTPEERMIQRMRREYKRKNRIL